MSTIGDTTRPPTLHDGGGGRGEYWAALLCEAGELPFPRMKWVTGQPALIFTAQRHLPPGIITHLAWYETEKATVATSMVDFPPLEMPIHPGFTVGVSFGGGSG